MINLFEINSFLKSFVLSSDLSYTNFVHGYKIGYFNICKTFTIQVIRSFGTQIFLSNIIGSFLFEICDVSIFLIFTEGSISSEGSINSEDLALGRFSSRDSRLSESSIDLALTSSTLTVNVVMLENSSNQSLCFPRISVKLGGKVASSARRGAIIANNRVKYLSLNMLRVRTSGLN